VSFLYHEELYRSPQFMKQLEDIRITICGAGALGANLAESLIRSGVKQLKVIDRDRIEERNLSTQPYFRADVGSFKAKILSASLFRAVGAKVQAECKELTSGNVRKFLKDTDLVIDAFDNSVAREAVTAFCLKKELPCLHTGMATEYAEVIWNELYQVPSDAMDDICDYPLARNLVTLTSSITSEVILRYIATGQKENYTLTFGDLKIQPYPPAS